jgi:hypothetical protein
MSAFVAARCLGNTNTLIHLQFLGQEDGQRTPLTASSCRFRQTPTTTEQAHHH